MPIAKANGIELYYDSFGDPSQPTLVLLMGLGCQMVLWSADFCQQLASRGYRVVRYDHRDIGHSTKMNHLEVPRLPALLVKARLGLPTSPPYSLRDMALDVLGLLDALGVERAHLVGASMGGMIAQHAAILAPHRLRSLVLWMTSAHHAPLPPPKLRVLRHLFRRPTGTREGDIALGVSRLRSLSSGLIPFDEELTYQLVSEAYDRDPSARGFIRQLAAVVTAPSRAKELSTLQVPTLVMHGALDPMVPVEHGYMLAKLIPNARMRVFEKLGHDYPTALWPSLIETIHQHASST